MNDRIQQVLDGDLPREALDALETAELDAYEEATAAALAGLRGESAPDVSAAVMKRVAALPKHGAPARTVPAIRAIAGWLWSPRSVALRPAYGLLAVAAAFLLLMTPWAARDPVTPADPALAVDGASADAPTDGAQHVFVHFRLDVQDANSVRLAGDFTDWQPRHTLREVAPGVWSVVVPVTPGVHQYSFVVDDEQWVVDPVAPIVDDGFGGTNSRLDVLVPVREGAL